MAIEHRTLRSNRISAAGAFFTQGMVFISLTTRLPEIQHHWQLTAAQLSLFLLMMVLLAGVGSGVAEALAKRFDSALLLRAGLLMMVVALPVLGPAPAFWVFVVALGVYGAAVGVVDATTNMQGVAVEHGYGRPILPSFHGAWTLGGVVGSALTLMLPNAPLSYSGVLAVVPAAAACGHYVRRVQAVDPDSVSVPWRPILLVGAAMSLFYMIDTATQTWGPQYLDKVVHSPSSLVALATFPYLLASLLLRFAGDALVARFGPVRVLRIGALASFLALLLVVLAWSWPAAVVGFTLLGAGAAVIAPLSFSAAAQIAGGEAMDPDERAHRVDAVIARFNQFNYVGALLGAVMTGLVGASDLRYGFAVPMVLILAILPLAPAFRMRTL